MILPIRPPRRGFVRGVAAVPIAAGAVAAVSLCGIGFAAGPESSVAEAGSSAESHAVAGDAAWRRGWLGLARERWLVAAEEAEREPLPAVARRVRERLASLDALDALDREAKGGPAGADRTLPDPQVGLRIRWRARIDADPIQPAIAGGLVLWNTGQAVHALRLADGLPPWRAARSPVDSLLFPRGASRGRFESRPSRPQPLALAVCGGSALAILAGLSGTDGDVAAEAGPMLACLDLSSSAEGRLAWLAAAPAITDGGERPRPTDFDGPPTFDHEIAAIVVRTREPSDWLSLSIFDSRDGRLLWSRPLGQATARDGIDHAPAVRSVCIAEDRIVAATHAGLIAAFDRDGRPAWRTAIDGGGGAPKFPAAAAPAGPVFCRGRIVLSPRDRGGVLALDARSGSLLWDRPGLGAATIVGTSAGRLLVATVSEAGPAVVSLAIEDGSELARLPAAGPGPAFAGKGLAAADNLPWPAAASLNPAVGSDALVLAFDRMLFCTERPPAFTPP